jgi:hypothetical protein
MPTLNTYARRCDLTCDSYALTRWLQGEDFGEI